MKITRERLRQIIMEEVMARLTEQDDDSGYEDYKTRSRRDFLKKLGQGALAAAGGGAAFGPLGALVSQDRGARAARRRELYAANVEESNTLEVKIKELQDYLNNTAAFRWGKGKESMMALPGSEENVNGLPSQIDVLPPTYVIAAMVLVDKQNGVPGRFGIPDQQVDFGRSAASPQQIQFNLDTFFEMFPFEKYEVEDRNGKPVTRFNYDEYYLNASVLSNIEGIRRLPSTAFRRDTILPKPELLFATPDYVLPENGMTVEEYYNWLYYNQFLSFDEIAAAPEESEDREKLMDLYAAAQPGQWATMQRVAGEMRQDAIDNEQ